MTEIIVMLPCDASSETIYLEKLRVQANDIPQLIAPSRLTKLEVEIELLKAEIEQLKTAQKPV